MTKIGSIGRVGTRGFSRSGGRYFGIADEAAVFAVVAGNFGEFLAVAGGGAVVLFGAGGAFFFRGAHGFGALHFQVVVEFGAFADRSAVAEAEGGDLGLES